MLWLFLDVRPTVCEHEATHFEYRSTICHTRWEGRWIMWWSHSPGLWRSSECSLGSVPCSGATEENATFRQRRGRAGAVCLAFGHPNHCHQWPWGEIFIFYIYTHTSFPSSQPICSHLFLTVRDLKIYSRWRKYPTVEEWQQAEVNKPCVQLDSQTDLWGETIQPEWCHQEHSVLCPRTLLQLLMYTCILDCTPCLLWRMIYYSVSYHGPTQHTTSRICVSMKLPFTIIIYISKLPNRLHCGL